MGMRLDGLYFIVFKNKSGKLGICYSRLGQSQREAWDNWLSFMHGQQDNGTGTSLTEEQRKKHYNYYFNNGYRAKKCGVHLEELMG
jgi:hypothetical protein